RTDTDGDTFSDWAEINARSFTLTINGVAVTRSITTLPYTADSDGDGLTDDKEWYGTSVYGVVTDPSDPDTDHDGLADGQERYMKEVAMPTRKSAGTYVNLPLSVRIAGPVEKATLAYGLSTIDVSNFYVGLSQGSNSVVVRNHQGSGLVNFSSVDLPASMQGGGTYTLTVSSWASGGILEKFSILFTIRTSPIRADTDADGLNDSEEMSYGQDGWITDPQLPDTDGDSWNDAYEISTKGTNPLSVDTDGDRARDNVDLDPLRNLVVRVTVNNIHHGASPWCTPELVGIVRVNDAYTWVTEHRMATEDGYWSWGCLADIWSTGVFGLTYYADVPDDVATANVRMTGWSVNPTRGDDNLVDQSLTYTLNAAIPAQTFSNGNSWITFDVATVGLAKARTLLITDGNVTVRSAAGQTRMAGQDRFFVFALDVNAASTPFVAGINTILVPRSIFLDTKLKADFSAGSYAPLSSAPLYGDDLAKAEISDGVAGVVAATLTAAQAADVLNRLLRNASGGTAYSYVDLTSQALVANLPADVVRILPWQAVTNGPTGAMPADFWSKIGAGASTVVNSLVALGQMVHKGLVALGTFLVNLGEAIADWGMRALGAVWNVVVTVAQKVAAAAASLFNWVKDLAISAFNLVVEGFKALVNVVLREAVDRIVNVARQRATIDSLLFGLPLVLGAVLRGEQVLERLFAAMEIVEASLTTVLAILSGGVAAFVKGLVATAAKDSVMDAILGAVLAATVGNIVITTIESFDDHALDNVPGQAAKGFVGALTALGAALDYIKARKEAQATGITKWFSAAGWALFGLLVEIAGSPFVEWSLGEFGLVDPLSRGIGQLGVDVVATIAASYGLYKLYKTFPGEVFLEGTRKALLPITDKIENWVTYVGFFGSSSALGLHIGEGLYKGFNQ
ncbi:MAG TPA: hypothetical protein VEL81_05250, partial [Thermoplasmata archaeon]|nr:hypothetical protein [Thermoplasmata archaeon]